MSLTNQPAAVKTGLDILKNEAFHRLKGLRIALLAHPASVDSELNTSLDLLIEHGLRPEILLGPEHGYYAVGQDMESMNHETEAKHGIPIKSLYGSNKSSLEPSHDVFRDIDVLLCDLQDIGARYYTYANTIALAMKVLAELGKHCVVIDRPNPLNASRVEGNLVDPALRSFGGQYSLANRHGMTMGELALFYNDVHPKACSLDIVWMQNYKRSQYFDETGLPWIFPSPNMPTVDTAIVYPGLCLLEATNLSEGRGTTKPFEVFGAPYIKYPHQFCEQLNSLGLNGVTFRPIFFKPQFQKHAKRLCGGAQIHVNDRAAFNSLATGLGILLVASQEPDFSWRTETYEFESKHLAIDLLLGDLSIRKAIESNSSLNDVIKLMHPQRTKFLSTRQRYLWKGYDQTP